MWLPIFCFCCFWALVDTESADVQECWSCREQGSDQCEYEETIRCLNATQCATVSGFLMKGKTRTNSISKGCPPSVPCDSWLCISMNGVYFQSYVKCSTKMDQSYYIPSDENEQTNGKRCESCYEEGTTEGCNSDSLVDCRGDETLCGNYRGILRYPDGSEPGTSFRGCLNPQAYEHYKLFYLFTEIRRFEFTVTE
ncbi:uncharacterized protein PAF06_015896 [Gastrophryne carolinensis]